MNTILLLNHESRSPKQRVQNVTGNKVTQRPSEGAPGCNCDRWGHPSPNCVVPNVSLKIAGGEESGLPTPIAMESVLWCVPRKS
jgi:hypothetical protein